MIVDGEPEVEAARPLLIVDGDNLAHRAYHSTPKTVTGVDGSPINALVGFFSMLVNVWTKETANTIAERQTPSAGLPNNPTPNTQYPGIRVFVAWDTLGVDTYRSKLWPPYQTGRVFEREIVVQLDLLPTLCQAFGFGVGKMAGYEADDLMAAAALKEVESGGTCLLLTTDRDAYQLVSEKITVLAPRRGARELDRIGPSEVVQRFGVLPEQVPDFKALCGDPSDKIPGVRGIGPVAAARLLLKHGTLEGVLSAWGEHPEAERALMFREVVRMRPEVAVELPSGSPDWTGGAATLRLLGANAIADRLGALG
ncbi:MAG: 5'-3' exonuclease H3TH domain-containing protein [Fimbriimonadales bacterium]